MAKTSRRTVPNNSLLENGCYSGFHLLRVDNRLQASGTCDLAVCEIFGCWDWKSGGALFVCPSLCFKLQVNERG